jgi:hypothetical protein
VGAARITWLTATLLAAACLQTAHADDWKVILEQDGIVVSRRSVAGQTLPQLRAVAEVSGTPYEVLAVLLDVPEHVAWRPDCAESRIVRRISHWKSLTYTRIDTPWPLADRDVVVEDEVLFVDPPSSVKVSFQAVAAPDVESGRHVIRMPRVAGSYSIEATQDSRSRVHYELEADIGGSVPDWFVAMQSARNPFRTLAGLRKQLERTRGRYDEEIALFPQGTAASRK